MCMALFENCLNWWSLIQMPCKLYPVLIDAFEEYRLACWTILHAILSSHRYSFVGVQVHERENSFA